MFFGQITLQDANLYLPLIRDHCCNIQKFLNKCQESIEIFTINEFKKNYTYNYNSNKINKKDLLIKEELKKLEVRILDEISSLNDFGAIVQNINPTFISFLSKRYNQFVYLNWMYGEDIFSYWHNIDESFSSRHYIDNDNAFGKFYIN